MHSCVVLFQRIVGKLVSPSAEWEHYGKAEEGIGSRVLQPGFIMKSGQVIKGALMLTASKKIICQPWDFRISTLPVIFHHITDAKPSVFKFWNFLFCTHSLKSAAVFLKNLIIMPLRGCILHPYSLLELNP